jgi:hypothetical protein
VRRPRIGRETAAAEGDAIDPSAPPTGERRFASFAEFYPYCLPEHAERTCRRLHFAGARVGLACVAAAIATGRAGWLLAGLVAGYAFAWVGHFFFERNRPATFKSPLWSVAGDWVMYRDMPTGRIRL